MSAAGIRRVVDDAVALLLELSPDMDREGLVCIERLLAPMRPRLPADQRARLDEALAVVAADIAARPAPVWINEAEVAALIEAAKDNRHGNRDRLAIALAYHHGLRVSELVRLPWSAIDLDAATITIVRKKGGRGGTHPLDPDCHRWLTALKKAQKESKRGLRLWVFVTERNTQMTVDAFASQLKAAAERAGITNVHPHNHDADRRQIA